MFSFASVKKREDDWRIYIISWSKMDKESIDYFAYKIKINGDDVKTDLIKAWNGYLCDGDIKFKTQEETDLAINGYLQPRLTAFKLANESNNENRHYERERA